MDTVVDRFDHPLSQTEERVMALVDEARDLRHGEAGDPEGTLVGILNQTTVPDLVLALRRVRARSDRVDGLLFDVRRMMGRVRRARDDAAAEAQDATDQAHVREQDRRLEYSGVKDRQAAANLATIDQRRSARLLDRLVDVTREGFDQINAIHWELNALREDLRTSIRALQFESSLER